MALLFPMRYRLHLIASRCRRNTFTCCIDFGMTGMSSVIYEPRSGAAGDIETPSGKWRADENFPVGSWLIRRDLRAHVHAFYRFARTADDIADNPALRPDEKIRRLDHMAAVLDGAPGDDAPAATAMRQSLLATGLTAQHCHDVLRAFRQDAEQLRYRDWDELMGYCRYSAAPVGRQLLELHGEKSALWPASDALCAALQVLNHLQDCAADYHRLDRVYLPLADLAAAGVGVEALAAPAARAALRRVFDILLDRTALLVATARELAPGVAARGLRCECAVIVELAGRLLARLRKGDPLARRVGLKKSDFLAAFVIGVVRGARDERHSV
jgi:hydroxysqualene synthase